MEVEGERLGQIEAVLLLALPNFLRPLQQLNVVRAHVLLKIIVEAFANALRDYEVDHVVHVVALGEHRQLELLLLGLLGVPLLDRLVGLVEDLLKRHFLVVHAQLQFVNAGDF